MEDKTNDPIPPEKHEELARLQRIRSRLLYTLILSVTVWLGLSVANWLILPIDGELLYLSLMIVTTLVSIQAIAHARVKKQYNDITVAMLTDIADSNLTQYEGEKLRAGEYAMEIKRLTDYIQLLEKRPPHEVSEFITRSDEPEIGEGEQT